jgi:hypothetical protein
MRKTLALLIAVAVVALPSIASARSKHHHHRHHHRHHIISAPIDEGNAGPRFVGDAIHQIFVPFEVTFGPRRYN